MKKIKKLVCVVLSGIMMASAMSGCTAETKETTSVPEQKEVPHKNGTESPTAENPVESPAMENPRAGEPVSLRFARWGNDARYEKTIEVIKMYQEKYPNVTIEPEYRGKSEREKVATELGSGTLADIVQLNPPWVGDFASNDDFSMDLGQYGYDTGGFDKKLIDNYCTYNGTLITPPNGLNARCYIMNKTKLDEFDIPSSPDTAWTWDDLITIGRTIHEKNPNMYFLNIDKSDMVEFVMRPYIIQKTGKFLIDDNFELGSTRDNLVDVLNYAARLYMKNVAVLAMEGNTFLNTTWTNPNWIDGKPTSRLSWTSPTTGETSDPEDTFVPTGLPIRQDAKDISVVVKPSQLYAIVKTCENPEVAADFLSFLPTDEEAGKVSGDCRGVSPYKAVQDACMEVGVLNESVIIATQYAQENAGLYENTASINAEITAVLIDAAEVVPYDSTKVESAADRAMTLIEDILSALR